MPTRLRHLTTAPSNYKYKVQGLGKNTVTITSVNASISSITFNLGDNNDSFRVLSARDGLVVHGGDGVDLARISNQLNLAGCAVGDQ